MTFDTYPILVIKQQMGIKPLVAATWDGLLNGRQLETYLLSDDNYAVLNYPATGKFTIPVGFDVKINKTTENVTMPAIIIAWGKSLTKREH